MLELRAQSMCVAAGPIYLALLQARHSVCKTKSLNPGQMAKSLFLHLSMLLVVKRQVVWGRLDACLSSLNWT